MGESDKPEKELVLYAPPSCTLAPWDVTRLKSKLKTGKPSGSDSQNLGLETYMRTLHST